MGASKNSGGPDIDPQIVRLSLQGHSQQQPPNLWKQAYQPRSSRGGCSCAWASGLTLKLTGLVLYGCWAQRPGLFEMRNTTYLPNTKTTIPDRTKLFALQILQLWTLWARMQLMGSHRPIWCIYIHLYT